MYTCPRGVCGSLQMKTNGSIHGHRAHHLRSIAALQTTNPQLRETMSTRGFCDEQRSTAFFERSFCFA